MTFSYPLWIWPHFFVTLIDIDSSCALREPGFVWEGWSRCYRLLLINIFLWVERGRLQIRSIRISHQGFNFHARVAPTARDFVFKWASPSIPSSWDISLSPLLPPLAGEMWDNLIYQESWLRTGDVKCHSPFKSPSLLSLSFNPLCKLIFLATPVFLFICLSSNSKRRDPWHRAAVLTVHHWECVLAY